MRGWRRCSKMRVECGCVCLSIADDRHVEVEMLLRLPYSLLSLDGLFLERLSGCCNSRDAGTFELKRSASLPTSASRMETDVIQTMSMASASSINDVAVMEALHTLELRSPTYERPKCGSMYSTPSL